MTYYDDSCRRCGGHKPLGTARHQCPPKWPVRFASDLDDGWVETYGRTEIEAAEQFCKETDAIGDYDVVRTGWAEVIVKLPNGDEVTFEITAHSEPVYNARRKRG